MIILPRDHSLLAVQNQNGIATIWAIVDPDSSQESIDIMVVDNGKPFDWKGCTYLDTVQILDYVGHVFFKRPPRR